MDQKGTGTPILDFDVLSLIFRTDSGLLKVDRKLVCCYIRAGPFFVTVAGRKLRSADRIGDMRKVDEGQSSTSNNCLVSK